MCEKQWSNASLQLKECFLRFCFKLFMYTTVWQTFTDLVCPCNMSVSCTMHLLLKASKPQEKSLRSAAALWVYMVAEPYDPSGLWSRQGTIPRFRPIRTARATATCDAEMAQAAEAQVNAMLELARAFKEKLGEKKGCFGDAGKVIRPPEVIAPNSQEEEIRQRSFRSWLFFAQEEFNKGLRQGGEDGQTLGLTDLSLQA